MKLRMYKIGLLVFLCGWAAYSASQNDVDFVATASQTKVRIDKNFEVVFLLKNTNGREFTPPDFRGFDVLSGPNSSNKVQIVNGQVYKETGFGYILRPTREGKFTIGSASIVVAGKTLKSKPLEITIIGSGATSDNAHGQALFVKAVPEKEEIYIGEQITLDYKLFTTVTVERHQFRNEPDYPGFFAEELFRFQPPTETEIINGQLYTTKILRRLSLFALQTGEHLLDVAQFNFVVVDNPYLFFNRNVRSIQYQTEPVRIRVLPLPEGAPPSFSGAVGAFDFQYEISSTKVAVGDAVSLSYFITGDGDFRRIKSPGLTISDSIEVYPPRIVQEQQNNQTQSRERVTRVVEYLLFPKHAGNYKIQPEFGYFDPEEKTYRIIKAEPFILEVKSGTGISDQMPLITELPGTSILPVKYGRIGTTERSKFAFSVLFWILLGAPVVFLFFIFYSSKILAILKFTRKKISLHDTAFLNAVRELDAARHYLDEPVNYPAFYDGLARAIKGYLSLVLKIDHSHLSRQNISDSLRKHKAQEQLINQINSILQTAELTLYAGLDTTDRVLDTYNCARQCLYSLRDNFSK